MSVIYSTKSREKNESREFSLFCVTSRNSPKYYEAKGNKVKRLLTISETAIRTNLTEKALRMRIFRKEFPFLKVGKRVFVEEGELEKFLVLAPQITAEEAAERAARAV